MKFSEAWLRQFVNPPLSSEALARALTMAGLEVEAREPVAPPFSGVVVGEVVSAEPHPNADRLRLCEVKVGEGAALPIVCGAPNVAAGQKVALAKVGAQLPNLVIQQSAIRGIESQGMLCSEKELGLSDESAGILLLPNDAPLGADLRAYLDLDDHSFVLKLTPNRGDCLSVLGVAREVAAITSAPLNVPAAAEVAAAIDDELHVTLAAPQACPRYCGRVLRGVNARASTPAWLRLALERSGLRNVSAIVDVTNYVMLERGQPLHAFDLAKLHGGITVRFAGAGERLVLLNQQEVVLTPDLLLIADDRKAVGLAGIMGGENTAVSDETRDVFLESAFFAPAAIIGRSRRLGLTSDAGHRFERGVDYQGTRQAIERATRLLLDICGGQAGPLTDTQATLPSRAPVTVRAERVGRVLGERLSDAQIGAIFRRLAFAFVFDHSAGTFQVQPPSYRFDLGLEIDFIEEIARLHGYERIGSAAPKGRGVLLPAEDGSRTNDASDVFMVKRRGVLLPAEDGSRTNDAPDVFMVKRRGVLLPAEDGRRDADRIRAYFVDRDYREVITYSFVAREWEADFAGNAAPVALTNPIASQLNVMRSTLLGGLIATLRTNLNRKAERVRIFEIGRCFTGAPSAVPRLDEQPMRAGGLCYGSAAPEQWAEKSRRADLFDVKGELEALAAPAALRCEPAPHPALHPGRSARVLAGAGNAVGWLGELHPLLAQRYELPSAPVVFELDLAALTQRPLPAFREPSRFPIVRRDLAFVVDEQVPIEALLSTLRSAAAPIVQELALFDLYRGEGVPAGKKSVAFRIVMNDTSKTLADEEIDASVQNLVQALADRYAIQLRVSKATGIN